METTRRLSTGLISLFLLMLSPTSQATLMGYSFEWIGTSNYTMTGMFTYDDADAADGAIRDSEVASLIFEGFLNGVSIGVNTTAHTLAGFNFNFDTVAGQFFLNSSNSSGDFGQRWNYQEDFTKIGFVAGGSVSGLFLNGNLGWISNPVPLTAASKSVPEPNTLALLGIGLAGVGFIRRKRKI